MFILKSTHKRLMELQKAQSGQTHAVWVANCHHKDVSIVKYVQEIRKLNAAIHRKNYTISRLEEKIRNGDKTLRSDIQKAKAKAKTKTKKVKK